MKRLSGNGPIMNAWGTPLVSGLQLKLGAPDPNPSELGSSGNFQSTSLYTNLACTS